MNFLYVIILLASLQGYIMAILLFRLRHNKDANRLLGILLFLIATAGINLYLEGTGWYYQNTANAIAHALVPGVVLMPVGPLIYFYIRANTDSTFKRGKKELRHFLPVIIDIVPQIAAVLLFASAFLEFKFFSVQSLGTFIDNYNVYSDIPRWISLTIYLLAAYKLVSSNPQRARLNQRLLSEKSKWPRSFVRLFLLFQLLWLPFLALYCIPSFTDRLLEKVGWFPVYIPLAVLIYYIGLKGYLLSWSTEVTEKTPKEGAAREMTPDIIDVIKRSMTVDKKYLDPLLDLSSLSKHTGIPLKTISFALNHHFKKNFSDFINSYRVLECQRRMADPALSHLTIIGIATDCGFRSTSTFQRVFKDFTGMSPSQYRKSGNLGQIKLSN